MVKKSKRVPTYEELNAFMAPSVLSPKYKYPISHDSPDYRVSHDSINESDSQNEDEDEDEYVNESSCIVNKEVDNSTYAYRTATKDLKIYDMKCLLDSKRKTILDKNNEIKESSNENYFLQKVVLEYEKMYRKILEEKQEQKKALKILSQYMRDISKTIKKDDFQLKRIRNDQKLLLDEIEKIREEVKYIASKSENLQHDDYLSSDNDDIYNAYDNYDTYDTYDTPDA